MSYDIWLEIDTGGEEPATIAPSINYTSNVSPMWTKALGHSLGDLHHRNAGESIALLDAAVAAMEAQPEEYRTMDPPNGWGSSEGALGYLRELRAMCAEHPKATIAIWR